MTSYKIKPVEELEFSDDFMFFRVMQNESICRQVLERLLGIKIQRVKKKELQKTLKPYYEAKGIRLDVYAADESRVFDVEMQKFPKADLPRRVRYYQSMLDADSLVAGENYSALKESYVLFICLNDPFGKNLPVYTFRKCCLEDKGLVLPDGAVAIFFNAAAFSKTENLALGAFLRYTKTQEAQDELTERIATLVQEFKRNELFRSSYMRESLALFDARKLGYDEGVAHGRAEGITQGRSEGIAEGFTRGAQKRAQEAAHNLLTMHVLSVEQIAQATGLSPSAVRTLQEQLQ